MRKKKLLLFCSVFICSLIVMSAIICILDPFFHYHAPNKKYYYLLDNERSQNNGIVKHFTYDAIITGTSLTENFKTTEFDDIYHTNSIKIPYSGATYYETAESVRLAYQYNHEIKYVFRSLDLNHLIEEPNKYRTDLGEYPKYLYNNSIWDDYKYFLNKDIFLSYCIPMIDYRLKGRAPGIQSFDSYHAWGGGAHGKEVVLEDRTAFPTPEKEIPYTEEDSKLLQENLEKNIISLAREHPDTIFIYFIPPYNVVWWGDLYSSGEIQRTFRSEEEAISMMIHYPNIKIYMYTNNLALTSDLNHYKDSIHYLDYINSKILQDIGNNKELLSKENYHDMLEEQKNIYLSYDYDKIFE